MVSVDFVVLFPGNGNKNFPEKLQYKYVF